MGDLIPKVLRNLQKNLTKFSWADVGELHTLGPYEPLPELFKHQLLTGNRSLQLL